MDARTKLVKWCGLALVAMVLAPAGDLSAAGAKFFRMQSRDAFLAGTLDGITVGPLGTLGLADRASRLADLEEPFLFSAAAHPDGWVVGTGNAGRVLLIGRDGDVSTLFEAPEPEVFAVWADGDGTVFAGTSPDGKVYRLAGGESEVWFEPGETYIWALARASDGALLVATGTAGKLYRVGGKGAGEVLFDSEDTHIRALKVLADGDALVGTAGEGLILRVRPDGTARTLHDAAQPEVVAFAQHPDGSCYAAVLASEASLVDLGRARQPAAQKEPGGGGDEAAAGESGSVSVKVTESKGASELLGSRPAGFSGARSEVLHLTPEGRVETVWEFDSETVYDLQWGRERLWVATGQEGKVYSLADRKMILEKDVDERQVVALMGDSPGPAFATTNASALYRFSSQTERRGEYTSPALDAGQISRFGSLHWRGEQPKGTGVEFSFRTGISAEPDATWAQWSAAAEGSEVQLGDLPGGRYLQWKASFSAADGRSPSLFQVDVSYRQLNLPPRIESLSVLGPGEILVPATFNPSNQIFEPAHPNRQGIFTTIGAPSQQDDRRHKTLWKKGYRTLRWKAEDPNGDDLVYVLSFRPLGGDRWLEMADDLEADIYSFDAGALPDGVYRFRLQVADRGDGDLGDGLQSEEISEPVLIDNRSPVLADTRIEGDTVVVTVADALNPLREAEVSVDAGEWREAKPRDGILDGLRETLVVERPADAGLILLRITDAAFNSVTFDISGESR